MSKVRAINKYTLLRERKTGRVGFIKAFRIDLEPRNLVILVKFEKLSNPVAFTGLHNICDTFEVVRKVNGVIRSAEGDALDVMTQADDLEGGRFKEMSRTVRGE